MLPLVTTSKTTMPATPRNDNTVQLVKEAARMLAGVTDFDARYQATLQLVKGDIETGQQLQVQGTPTFFMNGIRLPGLRASFLDAAIALEMKRAGVALK